MTNEQLAIFNGTPFKELVWRLLGVKIGKRVFDDGCTLNIGSTIQPHSQEDLRLYAGDRSVVPLRKKTGRRRAYCAGCVSYERPGGRSECALCRECCKRSPDVTAAQS